MSGPLRGDRDTHLSQLVVFNQLRSVPVDQGVEGKTILPAGDGKARVVRRAPVVMRDCGPRAHRNDYLLLGEVV